MAVRTKTGLILTEKAEGKKAERKQQQSKTLAQIQISKRVPLLEYALYVVLTKK